jgi:transcriptional regulator with XRE-family HTH domain
MKQLPKLTELLKAIRVAKGMSQREWAATLGITASYVAQVESGRVAVPMEYIKLLPLEQRKLAAEIIIEAMKRELEV